MPVSNIKPKTKPKPEKTGDKRALTIPQPSATIFKSWADKDFYGPKATHVFLYGTIDSTSVQDLRNQLHEASKPIKSERGVNSKPRPIVVHVHSQGGDGDLGITIANFLREIPVPLAVVVDGYACSAVTPLLVSAQYRVMHEFSFVMFHEGSIRFNTKLKDSHATFFITEELESLNREYRRFYELNTSLSKEKLDDMLSRDIYMNASECSKYNVVDRVIKLSKTASSARWNEYIKQYPDIKLSNNPLTWKINMNHLYNYHNQEGSTANNLLSTIKQMNNVMTAEQTSATPLPIVLHTNYYIVPRSYWFDIATFMIHTSIMDVPVIGVIDNNIDLMRAIPCILAYKRYMYDNAYLTISLIYNHNQNPMTYYHDIKHNTELIRDTLIKLLKQYTKIPSSILDTLFDKRILLNAKQCKEYGIIDDIIPSTNKRLTTKSKQSGGSGGSGGSQCACSAGLSLNPPPDFDF